MYQVGELVMHGVHGICRIADVEEQTVDRKKVRYLVLGLALCEAADYVIEKINAYKRFKFQSTRSKINF